VGAMPRTPKVVVEVLQHYGAATREGLKKYLPSESANPHLHDLLIEYPRRGGKMMRPSICIATARAFGASLEEALHTAIAIELIHNALLVHDDIQDESEIRRGEPTLHLQHGIPLAINAGDGLFLLSFRPLLDNLPHLGAQLAFEIFQETERMAWETAEGQAMELGWRRDNSIDLSDGDYLVMVLKKTCWLAVIYPSRVGAIIGSRGKVSLEQFIRFGFFLGSAFQIQDDLLNFVADSHYGKELNGDIFEGKRTLMLLHCFRQCDDKERKRVMHLLTLPRSQRRSKEIEWVRRLMDSYGSVNYAQSVAHALAGAALHEYNGIFRDLPETRDKEFICGLISWVFERI
jgi:geranylgeranyl diphosphate synthase, type II